MLIAVDQGNTSSSAVLVRKFKSHWLSKELASERRRSTLRAYALSRLIDDLFNVQMLDSYSPTSWEGYPPSSEVITAYRYLAGVCVRGRSRVPFEANMVACLRNRSWIEAAFPGGYAEVFAG